MRLRQLGPIATLCVTAVTALACSNSTNPKNNGGGPTGGSSATIVASDSGTGGNGYNYNTYTYTFSPTPDTVAAGTVVTFTFGDVTHTVIFDTTATGALPTGTPDSIPPAQSTNVTRTFATAGTYNYHCRIHTYMTGSVVVH